MTDFPLDSVKKDELLSLTHEFLASPDELLAAFTVADVFKQWYGPAGWTITDRNFIFEPKVGGRIQLVMEHESGPGVYAPLYLRFESITDTLLEFTEALAGPGGEPTDQLLGWRVRLTPTTVVTEAGVGQGTVLALEQGPLPEQVHDHASAAWRDSFTKLEKALAPKI